MNAETIVFLGPSLELEKAKELLPDALFLPPVKCGDIFKVVLLNPKTMLIIDGFFEQTAAVWHKEILFALESGIAVFGASSMGALRAAELCEFGMTGMGKIFELYRDGYVDGDDEVSLPHLQGQKDYKSAVTPLVNVRFTLEKAVHQKIIEEDYAHKAYQALKKQAYFERSLFKYATENKIFSAWLKDHYVDQKKWDAIFALKQVAGAKVESKAKQLPYSYTVFTKRLYREIMSEPLALFADDIAFTLDPHQKCILRDFAKLMQIDAEIKADDDQYEECYDADFTSSDEKALLKFYKIYRHLYHVTLMPEYEHAITELVRLYGRISAYLQRNDAHISTEFMPIRKVYVPVWDWRERMPLVL